MDRLYKIIYAKCLRYLGLRMRTEVEMQGKMRQWIDEVARRQYAGEVEQEGLGNKAESEELILRILAQLKREGFVNDQVFAKEWVVSRLKRGKRGPGVIRMELRQKGVGEELIDAALAEIEEAGDGVSEVDGARMSAQKYLRRLEGKKVYEQKAKLYAYLRGKGFGGGVAAKLTKELIGRSE